MRGGLQGCGAPGLREVTWPLASRVSCTRPFVRSGERWRSCAGRSAPCLAVGAGGCPAVAEDGCSPSEPLLGLGQENASEGLQGREPRTLSGYP